RRHPRRQALARDIICDPAPNGGIVLTNLPPKGWMSYAQLSAHRPDLIMMRLTGNHDGSAAVDYTVNCASGFPIATGDSPTPVNHVLPAWDVSAGLYLALGIVAAERARRLEGGGQEITLALSDVMLATVGNLGYIGDVMINGASREPIGNHLYGAFGRDFKTADDRRVMLTAISSRQWRAIGRATGLTEKLSMIGALMDVDLDTEGGLFHARDAICAVLAPWFAARTLEQVKATLEGSGVLWGPYQDFRQLVEEDPRCSLANPIFSEIEQDGIGRLLAPRGPLSFSGSVTPAVCQAPILGKDTEQTLKQVLKLSDQKLAELAEKKVFA
ncbi:CoA transferase, partial [Herbaspirillum sp. B65]|uniref:CoA transferase n=1 Tax=Herbaspirillum sp. B65 TaxID=137708 RepID=UPI0005C9B9D6